MKESDTFLMKVSNKNMEPCRNGIIWWQLFGLHYIHKICSMKALGKQLEGRPDI